MNYTVENKQFERDGITFKASQKYYVSPDGSLFEDGELSDENQIKRQDAYRKVVGLLTSFEIKSIRESFSLSQKDFALILGLGEVSVTRFETKMVQSSSIDTILRIPVEDPLRFYDLFQKNKGLLNKDKNKLDEIDKKISSAVEDERTATMLTEQLVANWYFPFREQGTLNGKEKLDFKKISTIDHMGAQKMKMTKTKLAKFLFYCDFSSYKLYGHGITGLVYQNATYGALPIGYNSILTSPQFTIIEESFIHLGEMAVAEYCDGKEYAKCLTKEEKGIVNSVIKLFSGKSTEQIVAMMHEEDAYKKTKRGDVIDYSFASSLKI